MRFKIENIKRELGLAKRQVAEVKAPESFEEMFREGLSGLMAEHKVEILEKLEGIFEDHGDDEEAIQWDCNAVMDMYTDVETPSQSGVWNRHLEEARRNTAILLKRDLK